MKFLKSILIFFLLGVSSSGFSQNLNQESITESDKQTIEITINSEKFLLNNARPNTKVDVFSIIGAKVTSVEVRSGYGDSYISLPKGYYIIKADNVSRKIAVK